jgi:N-acyl-phosphatidylethanolamine-hydrolysing phospholipase D
MMENDNFYKALKKKGRFVNFNGPKRVRRTAFDFLCWKLGLLNQKSEKIKVPKDFAYPKFQKAFDAAKPWVMWVGHCTFLIKAMNNIILTDPIWNEKCSPFKNIGPKRRYPPAIDLNQLVKVDYVLISHNHYDHLDKKTIIKLHKKFPNIVWIVPLGIKKWLKKLKIENVHELDWWQSFKKDDLEFFATPAQHYSGRGILDANKALWAGFVIDCKKANKKLYFTGDTGYNEIDFKKIGKKFESLDLSLIPIGTYMPRRFMSPVHIDPQSAVKIHKDINSKLSLAMHWKVFHLSDEAMLQPPYELYTCLKHANIDFNEFIVLELGSYVNW